MNITTKIKRNTHFQARPLSLHWTTVELRSFFCPFFLLLLFLQRKKAETTTELTLSLTLLNSLLYWNLLKQILWLCITYVHTNDLTHQDLQGRLSLCLRHPTTPQLFLEPSSFFSVSFLVTLRAKRPPQNWVETVLQPVQFSFFFDLCLPRYKEGTAAIFTTLSFSSPSSLSSSSPTDTTSMRSVGLLLSLWFWPCSWDSDRMTICDHNQWKPSEIWPPNLPWVTVLKVCKHGRRFYSRSYMI